MNTTLSSSTYPVLSAVLVSWNRCRLLQKAIQSLVDQQYPHLEIIVVDNGSTDGSLEWLRQQEGIMLLENQKNVGASAARNQGTRIAKGEYVIYMDSDAELRTESALHRIVEAMQCDPQLAGMAGIYFSDESLTQLWCWSPCMNWEGYFDPVESMKPKENPPVLSTCFSVYRISALIEVGGFDEFFFYLYEDGDLSQRLWKKGYRLQVDPSIKILHHYAEPGRTQQDEVEYHYYTERLRMYFLIKNWGVKRFFKSWWYKVRNYKALRAQFPYLSLFHYVDIYLIRIFLSMLQYFWYIRLKNKKWI